MTSPQQAALAILTGKVAQVDAATIHDPDVQRAQRGLERVQKEPMPGRAEIRRAEQTLANTQHEWAKRQLQVRSVESGPRGGYYYVTAQGTRVYVRQNPGAEVVGQVSKHPFVAGLPATAYLQEPKKR